MKLARGYSEPQSQRPCREHHDHPDRNQPAAPVDHLRFLRHHAHLAPTFGNDKFALRAEAFARFFGTPTFLGAQTLIVCCGCASMSSA